jgi:hypothetical protein
LNNLSFLAPEKKKKKGKGIKRSLQGFAGFYYLIFFSNIILENVTKYMGAKRKSSL